MLSDLRLATPDDLAAVEEVVRRAYAPYVSRIGRTPGPMSDDYSALIRCGRVQVVERDGIQAILVLIPENDTMLLDNVAVLPSAQGSGLGSALLKYAEQIAKDQGHRFLRLYTNEAMTENIGLYRQIGYVETHRTEEKGLRSVYMIKALG